ncbi:MAG: hypothetical protein LAT61_06175 [Alcanivorax sp.]|nr:hypothetical protein [Alcanivorax sp.]
MQNNPAAAEVIRQLTDPPDAAQRRTALESALHRLAGQPPTLPGKQLLQDRARLVAAALAIRDDDLDAARKHLGKIQLESPSIAEAALLMAETWRRDGDPDAAVQWYLRIHQQLPFDAVTLEGLLGAAALMHAQGKDGSALTLYRQLYNSAMDALQQLAVLEQRLPTEGIDIILTSQPDITPSLQRAVAAHVLRLTSHDVLLASDHAPLATRQLQCVLQTYVALSQQQEVLHARLDPLREQADQLQHTIGQRQQYIDRLMLALDTETHTTPASQNARRAIVEQRNILLQEQAQHRALTANLATLPDAYASSLSDLSALIAYHADSHLHHNRALEEGLLEALDMYRRLMRNSAGHSQAGLAALQDPM